MYAVWLLDQLLARKLERPFTKVPPEGTHLDTLNPAEVKSKLSTKVINILKQIDQKPQV